MKKAIGIDIGGTKISMVLGTRRGKILASRVIKSKTGLKAPDSVREIREILKGLMRETGTTRKDLHGIGVAVPGAVDARTGIIPRSPNLKGWQGIPIVRILGREFKIPVIMANDANAAVMAEMVFGQARQFDPVIYITVSTGIGGGIMIHGRLLEGAGFVAGEIGHMIVVPQGNLCGCGNRGCLEAHASGTAIANYVLRAVRSGQKTRFPGLLGRSRVFGAKQVGLAAREGDSLAIEAYEKAGFYLGIGISNLLNIINPELVVLGGGVWKSAPSQFLRAIVNSVRVHAWPEARKSVRVVRSNLKGSIGDLGAMALVFKQFL